MLCLTQSDTTFILEDTCRALYLTGTPVKLRLSTMYAENRLVSSHKVKGLFVHGFNSSLELPLPGYILEISCLEIGLIPQMLRKLGLTCMLL